MANATLPQQRVDRSRARRLRSAESATKGLSCAPPLQRSENADSGPTPSRWTWVWSVLFHCVLLLVLAMFAVGATTKPPPMVIGRAMSATEMDALHVFDLDQATPESTTLEDQASAIEIPPTVDVSLPALAMVVEKPASRVDFSSELSTNVVAEVLPNTEVRFDQSPWLAKQDAWIRDPEPIPLGHFELQGRAERRVQFSTVEKDYMINRALNWLARHQASDGSWCFDHQGGECRGRCGNPGSHRAARNAATGMALLPFLGAGHSPDHGKYKEVVSNGINYLIKHSRTQESLWQPQGRMYGQGIATLALCECYGIMSLSPSELNATKKSGVDIEQLRYAAEAAIYYIVHAQASGGGWRYMPRQRGDTSVVGWQIMALKSAQDAGLSTYPKTLDGAQRFLDRVQVQVEGDPSYGKVGTVYAYTASKNIQTPATTAIGLTCRIYLGTSPHHPGMKIAVARMADRGPILGNMYYNVYANQVMFQHGGAAWQQWDAMLVNQLGRTQGNDGHEEGSWFFGNVDHGGSAGGRLYATAMSCLCLEETFRHLPIYRQNKEAAFLAGFQGREKEQVAQPMPAKPAFDEQ